VNDDNQKDTTPILVLVGALLLLAGLWLLVGRLFDLPPIFGEIWQRIRSADEAVALIIIGAAIVVFAQRKDHPGMPAKAAACSAGWRATSASTSRCCASRSSLSRSCST